MDEFWRDKIIHRLIVIKQKLDKKCSLDWIELEILKLLIHVKLEVLNLDALPDIVTQIDPKLEQILKYEMSSQKVDEDGDTEEGIEEARQFLKRIPKFKLEK